MKTISRWYFFEISWQIRKKYGKESWMQLKLYLKSKQQAFKCSAYKSWKCLKEVPY